MDAAHTLQIDVSVQDLAGYARQASLRRTRYAVAVGLFETMGSVASIVRIDGAEP